MSIPIEAGDVIITHEIMRSKLGLVSKTRLMNDMIYDLPYGFVEAAAEALQPHSNDVPLFAITNAGTLHGKTGDYNLHHSAEIARKGFEMQWYVTKADHDNDRYSLVAIGGGREARIQDWEKIQKILSSEEIPDVTEFLFLNDVDSSFFEKKAVFRLAQSGTMEPLN